MSKREFVIALEAESVGQCDDMYQSINMQLGEVWGYAEGMHKDLEEDGLH